MGDGKVRQIAIIINGDITSEHQKEHHENAVRAASRLKEAKHEIYALDQNGLSGIETKNLLAPSLDNLKKLAQVTGADDDDVITYYFTGHGAGDASGAVIGKDVVSHEDVYSAIGSLPYVKRTVVMDWCFSGSSAKIWGNEKTDFISPDWQGRQVVCQLWAPNFWEESAKIVLAGGDINSDNKISIQERFAYAAGIYTKAIPLATPIDLVGGIYSDGGLGNDAKIEAPFPKKEDIELKDFENQLARLKKYPGCAAVVDFTADWCEPCKEYAPIFEKLAASSNGNFLFLRVNVTNVEKSELQKLGIENYPDVRLYNQAGEYIKVSDRNNPTAELYKLILSPTLKLELARKLKQQKNENGYLELIFALAKSDPSVLGKQEIDDMIASFKADNFDAAEALFILAKNQPAILEAQLKVDVEARIKRRAEAKFLFNAGLSVITDKNDLPRILIVLDTTLEYDPTFLFVLNMRAIFKINRLEDYAGAKVDAERLIQLAPYAIEGYHHLAIAELNLGNDHAAIEAAQKALKINDALLDGYGVLATSYRNIGKPEEALKFAEKGLSKCPDNIELLGLAGLAKNDLGHNDALEFWNKAIEKHPDETKFFYNGRGLLNLHRGKRNTAREDFAKSTNPIDRHNLIASILDPKRIMSGFGVRSKGSDSDFHTSLNVDWELFKNNAFSAELPVMADYENGENGRIALGAGLAASFFDIGVGVLAGYDFDLKDKGNPFLEYKIDANVELFRRKGLAFLLGLDFAIRQNLSQPDELGYILQSKLGLGIW